MAKPILEDKDYTHLCHMMEDIVQLRLNEDQLRLNEDHLRLNEDRQELFEYAKPDFILQNIASIERPSKEQVIAQYI